MAALVGLRAPEVVVSRVLIDALDDRQLEALLAHELAHAARGGNRRLTLLWLLRAAQALNPAALIAFRQLVETEEAACDALAARATKRPADLASVLIEVERLRGATRAAEDAPGEPGAHLALLQRRVRRLLDGVAEQGPRGPVGLAAAALLGALLWGVG
ncbi:MAG: M48 family metalloprotease [Myxococcales bacterium]|nr:M48 family metalloprotease [Myxococcales bacterium]